MKKWIILVGTIATGVTLGLKQCHDVKERGPLYSYKGYDVSCSPRVACSEEQHWAIKKGIDASIHMFVDLKVGSIELQIVPHPIKNHLGGQANGRSWPDIERIWISEMDPEVMAALVRHESGHVYKYQQSKNADPLHKDTWFWDAVDSPIR